MAMQHSRLNLVTGQMERRQLIEELTADAEEALAQVRLADEYEQWRREVEGGEPVLELAPGCRMVDGVVYYSAAWL